MVSTRESGCSGCREIRRPQGHSPFLCLPLPEASVPLSPSGLRPHGCLRWWNRTTRCERTDPGLERRRDCLEHTADRGSWALN